MIPYKEAAEEFKRQSDLPSKVLKNIAGAAAPIAAGSLFSKAIPFLNNYLTEDIAIKGLSKLSPKLGNFIKEAQKQGYDFNKVRDFLGDKIQQTQAQESRNIIEQYSPELHQFLKEHIQKGRSPIEAGALAQNDKRFNSIIKKISKEHKSPWSAIIETVFGKSPGMSKEEARKKFLSRKKSNLGNELIEQFEGHYGPMEQQPQAGNQDAELMAAIQKVLSM